MAALQAYGKGFARVYNAIWQGFARQAAPLIRTYYERLPMAAASREMLDLCCGTGQLALHFLEHGYRVDGLDLSSHMLEYARENNADYLKCGAARFFQGDAADFRLDRRYGLIVSTFDALNHLPHLAALAGCFRAAAVALREGGCFIFDLNTRAGLRKQWNYLNVEDGEAMTVIQRGFYDEDTRKAYMKISGYTRNQDGSYERFEELVYNTGFELSQVREELLASGWGEVHFARLQALAEPVVEPEMEPRIFVVAKR